MFFLTAAHRRKLQAKLSVSGPSSAPLPPASIQPSLFSTGTSSNDLLGGGGEGQEESSGGEEGGEGGTPPQWNWREDEKSVYEPFNEAMMCSFNLRTWVSYE